MGCYWYTINHISGVGFIVDPSKHIDFLESWKENIDFQYQTYIFCPDIEYKDNQQSMQPSLLIMDKRTLSMQKMILPGPHYVEPEDHRTIIGQESNPFLLDLYGPICKFMNAKFGVDVNLMHVMSSFGVYPFTVDASSEYKSFESVKNYLDYHGYFVPDLHKDFWIKAEKFLIGQH